MGLCGDAVPAAGVDRWASLDHRWQKVLLHTLKSENNQKAVKKTELNTVVHTATVNLRKIPRNEISVAKN